MIGDEDMRSIHDSMLPIVWNLTDPDESPISEAAGPRYYSPIRPVRPTHLIVFGVEGDPKIDIMHNGNTIASGAPARLFEFPNSSEEVLREWNGPIPARCSFETGASIMPSDRVRVIVRGPGSVKAFCMRGFGQYA